MICRFSRWLCSRWTGPGLVCLLLFSCRPDFQPRPRGYNRLPLPRPEYIASPDTLPYQFEYSKHARLLRDTTFINDRYWLEVYYPLLRANIHITYKQLENKERLLKELYTDAFRLTAKHQIKAHAIDETVVRTPSGKTALIAEIQGEVPSQFQFTITDSTRHFLRGAVYFFTEVKNDSLQPAIEYMKKDAMHLINTLQWRER
jgi:gliding motility-associated lipoprotein GldD